MRAYVFLLPFALVGCAPTSSGIPASSPPSATTHEGGAVTDAERTVQRFILDGTGDPKSVEFSRWGPDMAGKEYTEMVKNAMSKDTAWKMNLDAEDKATREKEVNLFVLSHNPPFQPGASFIFAEIPTDDVKMFVRVKYRATNRIGAKQMNDELYTVSESNPSKATRVGIGSDDWFGAMKERLTH